MKEIYEMHGRGHSARAIPRGLRLARNTVLKYLNSPEAMPRGSKLDPYTEYIDRRLAEGLGNCVVLLRELRTRGYTVRRCGQPNILASCRRLAPPAATCISDSPAGRPVRFTSGPWPSLIRSLAEFT